MFKKYTTIFVLSFLFPLYLIANEIAILPNSPNLTTGTLPNGINYFIHKSQAVKGKADFALVQKLGSTIRDAESKSFVTKTAKKNLAKLPLFQDKRPQDFFISHGASVETEGFIEFRKDATIYRFKNILISKDEAIVDSTLLAFFSIIQDFSFGEKELQKQLFFPEHHAIVISGDIEPIKIKEKLQMLSLMVPAKEVTKTLPEHEWNSSDEAIYKKKAASTALSKIELSYSMARMPVTYMNSVQPVIMDKFISELCIILENRIKEILYARSIPYTSLACSYISSLDTFKDESFNIAIEVLDSDIEVTLSTIAHALGTIDRYGVNELEYLYAKKQYILSLEKTNEGKSRSNTASLERCIASFLYNAPLSSLEDEYRFITNRVVKDDVELKLLNQISTALLDKDKNLYVELSTNRQDLGVEDFKCIFELAWNEDFRFDFKKWYGADFSVEPIPLKPRPKVKLRSSRKEAISGGQLWTYSNGVKVIYKKMNTGGKLHFALASTEGYASLQDIASGEGAYLTDIFNTYSIGSIAGDAYKRALISRGVDIDSEVRVFDTRITGSAPMDSLNLVLSILKDIALNRQVDEVAKNQYKARVPLELASMVGTSKERLVKVEEIMCPGYLYSSFKSLDVVTESLFNRSDILFKQVFNNLDEGFLVLFGDENEEVVKKKLLPIVASMPVSRTVLRRPNVRALPIVGQTTIIEKSSNLNTDLIVSNQLLLTTENYIAAQISSMLLHERMAQRLTADGFSVRSTMRFNQSPEERLTIYLSLTPVNPDGFVDARTNLSSLELVGNIRAALRDDIDVEYIKKLLPYYKTILKGNYERDIQGPDLVAKAVMLRYLNGKDLITRYLPALEALNAEQVMDVIKTLRDGATVEYIIEGDEK